MLYQPGGLCFCTAGWVERARHWQDRTAGRHRCGTKGTEHCWSLIIHQPRGWNLISGSNRTLGREESCDSQQGHVTTSLNY